MACWRISSLLLPVSAFLTYFALMARLALQTWGFHYRNHAVI